MIKPRLIIVVCWGNIHRSPLAAHFINQKIIGLGLEQEFVCISRGIQGSGTVPAPKFDNILQYETESQAALPSLIRHGIDLSKHKATPIDEETAKEASVILAIDEKILSDPENGLLSQFPHIKEKIKMITDASETGNYFDDLSGSGNINKYDLFADRMRDLIERDFMKIILQTEKELETARELKKNPKKELY